MKYEWWYKGGGGSWRMDITEYEHHVSSEPPDSSAKNGYHLVVTPDETTNKDGTHTVEHQCGWCGEVTLHRCKTEKNDSRPVATENDRPSKEVPLPVGPMLPSTDQEISNLLCSLDISRHGTIVSQLLAEGYAASCECLPLLSHYRELVQAYDKFRRELRRVLECRLDL